MTEFPCQAQGRIPRRLPEEHVRIEIWFSIMARAVLKGASFTDPRQIRQAIDTFIEVYNPQAAPFEWTKDSVHQVGLKEYYANLSK